MKCPQCGEDELAESDGVFLTCQNLKCDWYGTEHQQIVIDLLAAVVRQIMDRAEKHDGDFCPICQSPNYYAHDADCAFVPIMDLLKRKIIQ